MSDIHIREKDINDKFVTCIFHISVPEIDNAVGIQWNLVIKNALNPTPLMEENDSVENTNISNGNIYEVAVVVRFSTTNLTNLQRLQEVEDYYTSKNTEIFQKLKDKLNFFGKKVDI